MTTAISMHQRRHAGERESVEGPRRGVAWARRGGWGTAAQLDRRRRVACLHSAASLAQLLEEQRVVTCQPAEGAAAAAAADGLLCLST